MTSRVLINSILKRKFHALPQSQKFVITPEIKQAIKNEGPVVALESTIISHGNRDGDKTKVKCVLYI
jgi:pseudouridine-5'-phosphate glycosidase